MRYFSTRGAGPVTLDDALRKGIADDGGLFLPERLPTFGFSDFDSADSAVSVAHVLLRPFFEGSELRGELREILSETFKFDLPLTRLGVDGKDVSLLELYHGPTAAFKDVGAGFLAACLSRLESDPQTPLTILVATNSQVTVNLLSVSYPAHAGT